MRVALKVVACNFLEGRRKPVLAGRGDQLTAENSAPCVVQRAAAEIS